MHHHKRVQKQHQPPGVRLPVVLLVALLAAALGRSTAALAPQPDGGPNLIQGLASFREYLQQARAARGGGGAPAAAPTRPPREKVIPLPGGWGYINATYFRHFPVHPGTPRQPTGCGADSTDRTCGGPGQFDALRYAATMEELVVPKGYPLEVHSVTTEDGYNLALYRIPHGRYRNIRPGRRPLVFLQHGITLASNCFTVLNAKESLAFVLADAGFDVWMGNTRGNTYSLSHVNLSPYDLRFWTFSIDELARIDLPTMVDYALAKAGARSTAFVGHSQGCTLAFALLAARPEYNAKLSIVAQMGSVVFADDVAAPFLRFAAAASFDQALIDFQIPEFLPTRFTAPAFGTLCQVYPHDEICPALASFLFFGPSQFITPDDWYIIGRTWPSGVGALNLAHWAQLFRDRRERFSMFDYGPLCNRTKWHPGRGLRPDYLRPSCNRAQYGSDEPPEYDLSKVTAPQAFFLAEYDLLTLSQDIAAVYQRLPPGTAVAEFRYPGLAHMDFVWDRRGLHHGDLVDILFRFSPGTF